MSVQVIQDGDVVQIFDVNTRLTVMEPAYEVELESGIIGGVPFAGPYTVIPKIAQQVLATRDKMMRDDVTVTGIPPDDVRNEYGTTYVIAPEP